jgi:hypothetical protein
MAAANPTTLKFAGARPTGAKKEIAMSTTTTAAVETTATAKKAPAKKAPAKAAPATKAAEPKAEKKDSGKLFIYEAQGRAGVTNRRTFPHHVAVAADVKDPEHTSKRWQQGVITRFFATTEQAEKYAERQRETGCDVVLVPAKLVETKDA